MARNRGDYFQKRRKGLNQMGRGHLDKEKERSAKNRELQRTQASESQKTLLKAQNRERVRRCREKKRAAIFQAAGEAAAMLVSPFGNKAAETKALQR
jgi:hypothetical protein